MSALPPKADIRIGSDCARRSGFGNLALVAIRRALAGCTPGAAQNSLPANADFREGILGAVELAREGDPNLASPHASS